MIFVCRKWIQELLSSQQVGLWPRLKSAKDGTHYRLRGQEEDPPRLHRRHQDPGLSLQRLEALTLINHRKSKSRINIPKPRLNLKSQLSDWFVFTVYHLSIRINQATFLSLNKCILSEAIRQKVCWKELGYDELKNCLYSVMHQLNPPGLL